MLLFAPQLLGKHSIGLNRRMTLHHTLDSSDISGSTSVDKSGYGVDGTLKNSPTTGAAGHVGQGIAFNGTNQWIDFGNAAALDAGTSDFTVSFWFKTTNITSWRGLQKRGTGATGTATGWQASIFGNSPDGTYGNCIVSDASGNYAVASAAAAPHDNVFHHLVMTFSNSTGVATVYDNATAKASAAGGGTPAGKNYDNSKNATFGCAWNDASTQSQFFSGSADELKFWKRALSAAEVAALFAI